MALLESKMELPHKQRDSNGLIFIWGNSPHPMEDLAMPTDNFGHHDVGGGELASDIQRVEARDAVAHPTMHELQNKQSKFGK